MAIILYGNGLIEDVAPKDKTFTDEEITNLYSNFSEIKTKRLDEVPNTWCVWGEEDRNNITAHNNLGSVVVKDYVYSPILFIHDTELNPDWGLIETPIQKNYEYFREDLLKFIDGIAESIIRKSTQNTKGVKPENYDQQSNQDVNNLMTLDTIGTTRDKRILFDFDVDKQTKEFYKESTFDQFSNNVYEYLKEHGRSDNPKFVIYSDAKIIIALRDGRVKKFFDKIIKHFQDKEEYEKCDVLQKIWDKWNYNWNILNKKKQKDPSTNKTDKDPSNNE